MCSQAFVLVLASILSSGTAIGQVAVYDAGVAGNPPVPSSPAVAGWMLRTGGATTTAGPIVNDNGLNAWEVADVSAPGVFDHAYYFASPPGLNLLSFVSGQWELTATMKLTIGADPTTFLEISTGLTFLDTAYRIFFRVSGADVQVFDGYGGLLFTCPNGADGEYHRFSLRKVNTIQYGPVQVLFDGAVLGTVNEDWPGHYANDRGAKFGTWSNVGAGRPRFHRVELRSLDDLGTMPCAPATSNSTGAPGVLDAWGSPYVDQNLVELRASGLPPQMTGYVITSLQPGLVPGPGGSQGTLCLGGAIGRYVAAGQVMNTGAQGAFTLTLDLARTPSPNGFAAALPGETRFFQVWHHDMNPAATSNFTNSVAVDFR